MTKKYNPPLGLEVDVMVTASTKVIRTFIPGNMAIYHCYIKHQCHQTVAWMMTGETSYCDEWVLIGKPVENVADEVLGMAYDIALASILASLSYAELCRGFIFGDGALILNGVQPEIVSE